MFARVVSKWLLLGMIIPGRVSEGREEEVLGDAPLVDGEEVRKPEDVLDRRLKMEEVAGAGVGLVPLHHARPLRSRTWPRCRSR